MKPSTDWTCSVCGAGAFDREEQADGTVTCVSCRVREERRAEQKRQQVASTPRKARRTAAPRIGSPEDVAPALAEVMASASDDERVSEGTLLVLRQLHEQATERRCIETTASWRWLVERTGLGQKATKLALRRLDRLGYLRIISPAEVTRDTLRAWLKARETGRPPMLVRLAVVPPGVPVEGPKGGTKGGTKVKGKENRSASRRSESARTDGVLSGEQDSRPAVGAGTR